MSKLVFVSVSLAVLLFGMSGAAVGLDIESQEVTVRSSRNAADGEKVAVGTVFESAIRVPKAVLLVMPSVSVPGKNKPVLAMNRHEPEYYPLSRNREALLGSGLAMAWMGWPSEAQFGKDGTAHYDMQTDIARVIEEVR